MPTTALVVASLPRVIQSADWIERPASATTWSSTPAGAVACKTTKVRVNLERLTAELDDEFRRLFGPSQPPRRGR